MFNLLEIQQQIQIKLGWALFVTYTIIQSIMRSEMCSLHLTHPSVHTWSSGQPTVQRLGSSRGLPVGAGIRTHNLGLPRVSSPTLYPLGQRLPKMYLVLHMARGLAMCLFLFCVSTYVLYPCALMSIVLTRPMLSPHYWLSCSTCCPSLPSSFTPHLFSLCL